MVPIEILYDIFRLYTELQFSPFHHIISAINLHVFLNFMTNNDLNFLTTEINSPSPTSIPASTLCSDSAIQKARPLKHSALRILTPWELPTESYLFKSNFVTCDVGISSQSAHTDQIIRLYSFFNFHIPGLLSLSRDGKTISIKQSTGVEDIGTYLANDGEEIAVVFPSDMHRNLFMKFLGLETDIDKGQEYYDNKGYGIWPDHPKTIYLTKMFFSLSNNYEEDKPTACVIS